MINFISSRTVPARREPSPRRSDVHQRAREPVQSHDRGVRGGISRDRPRDTDRAPARVNQGRVTSPVHRSSAMPASGDRRGQDRYSDSGMGKGSTTSHSKLKG